MNQPYVYEIVVDGVLTESWSDWFGDMTLVAQPDNRTLMYGILDDQSALFGVLSRIHSLNLALVSVERKGK